MRHSGVEPPGMYSSGEFNDNEVLYMTQEGPLSIQRIECLLYTEGPCLVFTIFIQCMIYSGRVCISGVYPTPTL